ncbi:dihydroxyacetone (glycerone) kinase, DhaK2 subunit [Mycoplasmopsis canis UF31]|uniref:Dihydroxyacetone (Glycerone) kinase, DhaK2 subunit n=1 Tax=Mycoplasmopsis canis TaxID=29555 RepID=A0A449AQ88_9BACT|nr:DAK2 domain-containing protein [Mycoplasmopsis canis]AMD81324.1 dihydroxyacetone kinase [Mycoplasmopsis canis PG 14]EIE40392.1 dihydroxyacetone (glycerone) kinase, DhaK2 subunit [Mycoplasmopsis canis UF31]EIE40533.1 dihydroxyacetone (glycerone) kinase, DhaK2 subunit [Mycoplasmopsis canis PG 14]EIE41958.1 dihydroxyacetone (glycerone) kinase, DhaK2 subunit [Mycoplasmopsis canis UFG1]WQQ12513.1 DAK2 domain-containing protein [Mycoplasmopsis canis]
MARKVFIDGLTFAKAMISGANALRNSKDRIDALNVFPVPDGDTGTNMSSTAISIVPKMLQVSKDATIADVSKTISTSMIYEARGNSGVILSQIFKGFSLGCEGKVDLDLNDFLNALKSAVDRAYKSVFKPVEGTILTVIRETTEQIVKEFEKADETSTSLKEVWGRLLEHCRRSCDETPNKLKTLREVGVTDSGGEGLYKIFWGINEFLNGRPVEITNATEDVSVFVSDMEVYEGEFGYCTEVLIDLSEPDKFDKESFIKKIEKKANSLVVVSDDNILKVHGHTLRPGEFLNIAQHYGEFIKIKSENMTLQANNSKANSEKFTEAQKQEDRVKCAVVSCNLGSGIIEKMKELGASYVVESGETQNPSAQDIINAIQSVNADNVFILPNSSNVILVAQQAAQVIQDKNVIVLPTKTQIQGLTAIINFSPDLDPDDNLEIMNDSIENVQTGEVTKAIRQTKLNGVEINNGDFLSIHNGKIIASSKTASQALKTLIKKMIKGSSEIVSIYYGDEGSLSIAEELSNYIDANYEIEIEINEGNQPNYHYLIGVE